AMFWMVRLVCWDPSGFIRCKVALGLVTPVTRKTTFCPAVAVNVYLAFWPGAVVGIVTGEPSVVMGPVTSDASFSWTVVCPVDLPCGSTKTVYGPAELKVNVSKNVAAPCPQLTRFVEFGTNAPVGSFRPKRQELGPGVGT